MPEYQRTDTQPMSGLPLKDGGASRTDGPTINEIRRMLHAEDRRHDAHDTWSGQRHTYCRDCRVRLGRSGVV